MGNKLIIAILASLAFISTAFADDMGDGEKKPFEISGDFSGSMMFHDNEGNRSNTVGLNPHDEFNINLVEINLAKNWSKSSLNLSIGYGSTATAVNPLINPLTAAPANTLNLMHAYYSLMSDYGLQFMFGKWEAPFGMEHYNQRENAQFTRSYGFQLTPFFQTGLGLNYNGGMWDAGFIVSNGQGLGNDTKDNNKTMAVTGGINPMEQLAIDVNYITGTEGSGAAAPFTNNEISVLDVNVAYMLNEMLDFALNYTDRGTKADTAGAKDLKANSVAAYANAHFGMFGLGLRYETFSYDGGVLLANNLTTASFGANGITGSDNSINSITLAAKAEIDQNATVILEYRMDSSDDKIWNDKETPATATDSQNTITLGMMYQF